MSMNLDIMNEEHGRALIIDFHSAMLENCLATMSRKTTSMSSRDSTQKRIRVQFVPSINRLKLEWM